MQTRTGRLITYAADEVGEALKRQHDAGVPLTPLFDAQSTELTSRYFVLRPGHLVILSSFGLTGDAEVRVEKLRMADSVMPQGAGCHGVYQPAFETQNEEVRVCGHWRLWAARNLGVLSVPGTYRVRLSDAAHLGLVYVDGAMLDAKLGDCLPRDIFFGNDTFLCPPEQAFPPFPDFPPFPAFPAFPAFPTFPAFPPFPDCPDQPAAYTPTLVVAGCDGQVFGRAFGPGDTTDPAASVALMGCDGAQLGWIYPNSASGHETAMADCGNTVAGYLVS